MEGRKREEDKRKGKHIKVEEEKNDEEEDQKERKHEECDKQAGRG